MEREGQRKREKEMEEETLNPKPPNLTLTIRPEKLNPNSKPNKIKHDNL